MPSDSSSSSASHSSSESGAGGEEASCRLNSLRASCAASMPSCFARACSRASSSSVSSSTSVISFFLDLDEPAEKRSPALTVRPRKHPAAERINGVVTDPYCEESGARMPLQHALPGSETIRVHLIIPCFDVDRNDFADVLFGFDFLADAVFVEFLTAPSDLFAAETRVSHLSFPPAPGFPSLYQTARAPQNQGRRGRLYSPDSK